MSIPKDFLDLMRELGRPVSNALSANRTAALPDNDWTTIDLSNLMNVTLDAEGQIILVSTDTGPGNLIKLDPANAPVVFPTLFSNSVTIYAQSESAASGGVLQYFGFYPRSSGLAT